MSFSTNTFATMVYNYNGYYTTNGGLNWTLDGFSNTDFNNSEMNSFGDVAYQGGNGKIFVRTINMPFNVNHDWHGIYPQGYTGEINVDDIPHDVTQSNIHYDIRGGTCFMSIPDDKRYEKVGNDTVAQFYYWGGNLNGSLLHQNNPVYLINPGLQINADYKTNLRSTIDTALKYPNQVKILVDTNGITNMVYESMGGIFYTRSNVNNNYNFKKGGIC